MFFVGLHQPPDSRHFERSFNRLRKRRSAVPAPAWIMDSGAFSTIAAHGGYPHPVEEYAALIRRFAGGNLLAAVAQDYMCEPGALAKTGLTIPEHQRLTIERYDALLACNTGVYIMPVLQGFMPGDYVDHLRAYGARLTPGMWVGVGSVCKRNKNPMSIARVLMAIKAERSDLLLHGFGVKLTALGSGLVRGMLHSADSMAWSYAARMQGGNANDWREAKAFEERVESQAFQRELFV